MLTLDVNPFVCVIFREIDARRMARSNRLFIRLRDRDAAKQTRREQCSRKGDIKNIVLRTGHEMHCQNSQRLTRSW